MIELEERKKFWSKPKSILAHDYTFDELLRIAQTDIEALCEEVERLQKQVDSLNDLLSRAADKHLIDTAKIGKLEQALKKELKPAPSIYGWLERVGENESH